MGVKGWSTNLGSVNIQRTNPTDKLGATTIKNEKNGHRQPNRTLARAGEETEEKNMAGAEEDAEKDLCTGNKSMANILAQLGSDHINIIELNDEIDGILKSVMAQRECKPTVKERKLLLDHVIKCTKTQICDRRLLRHLNRFRTLLFFIIFLFFNINFKLIVCCVVFCSLFYSFKKKGIL